MVSAVVAANTCELRLYPAADGVAAVVDIEGRLTVAEMDCPSSEAVPLMRTLSYRYGSADAAICTDDRELNNLTRLGEREFAISDCLLYDRVEGSGMGNVTRFVGEGVFTLDDEILFRVIPAGKRTVSRLEYSGKSVLFIPGKVALADLPSEVLTADIAVVSDMLPQYRRIRCDTLVISAGEEHREEIAAALSDCCRETVFLDDEFVIRLR